MNTHNFDNMYYETSANRSPTSNRPLNRQPSRNQFDSYAHLPSGLYTAEDYQQDATRYGSTRNPALGGFGGGYDMGGQWNAGAFGQNTMMNGYGGSSLRKPPSRGRAGIPNVRTQPPQRVERLTDLAHRHGLTSPSRCR